MLWLPITMGIGTFALDRISKLAVSKNMNLGQSIPIIKNIFHITFQTNDGAAFSLLSGKIPLLVVCTLLIIAALLAFVIVTKPKSKIFRIAVSLIISGALGNLLDRVVYGYVVDFFDARFINFAVFNVADCCVVIGAALLCIYIFRQSDTK